jgi:hypothetical protein
MVHIGSESQRILRRSLARIQACVDQLVGQDVFIEAGGLIGMKIDPKETRKKVLAMLQRELDMVFEVSEQRSPAAEADASEWILRQLRP